MRSNAFRQQEHCARTLFILGQVVSYYKPRGTFEFEFQQIEVKLPGAYHQDQYIIDVFDGALTAKCKTFLSEVSSMKLKWARGNPIGWTMKEIVHKISSLYTNLDSDGTWARELDETDQIVALTPQVMTMQKELERTTVALATSMEGKSTPASSPADQNKPSAQSGGNNNHGANQPYTVKPWKLEFQGNVFVKEGTTFYWCTKDHWSNKVKYNGM